MQNVGKYSFMEQDRPVLWASFSGSGEYPMLKGDMFIYNLPSGFYISAEFEGLPNSEQLPFHIHEGVFCETKGGKIVPLPEIFSDKNGKSSMKIYVDKKEINDIAGRPAVLHIHKDEAEPEIACAILQRIL